MPYDVKKDDRCPAGKPWAVVKKDGGKLIGCHASKTEAQKQIEAIGANDHDSASLGGSVSRLKENLSRARTAAGAAVLRDSAPDAGGDGRSLFGHFSVFNTWYEVNSWWEGNFLERIAPGAFSRTIEQRGAQVKALYDHGMDPQLGNKPLGPFRELREDDVGGYYEIDLIHTDYNDGFVIPAARAGLLGSSFRFSVKSESWDDEPDASDDNPRALPQRTITDVELFELGPVTFPANPAATADVRSTTDDFLDLLLRDPLMLARFTDRVGPAVVKQLIDALPADRRDALQKQDPTGSADRQRDGKNAGRSWRSALAELEGLVR